MKNILMIGTGGTIASEMTPSGLTPELNSTQLLSFVPRIGEMCHVDCVQLYSLDSTNIRPAHWLGVAKTVRENYDRYDGFVISHGTDTMAYTAAALSYLIQGSPKPIVLTGAQKPIWFDGTDSKRNLTDAFLYACRGCGGVQIVFNGKVILAAYDAGDETAVPARPAPRAFRPFPASTIPTWPWYRTSTCCSICAAPAIPARCSMTRWTIRWDC